MGKQKEQVQENVKAQEVQKQESPKSNSPFIYVGPTIYKENFFLTQYSVYSEIPPYVKGTPYEKLFYPFEDYRQRKQEVDEEVKEKLKRIMQEENG